jgi:hypothetical protein
MKYAFGLYLQKPFSGPGNVTIIGKPLRHPRVPDDKTHPRIILSKVDALTRQLWAAQLARFSLEGRFMAAAAT